MRLRTPVLLAALVALVAALLAVAPAQAATYDVYLRSTSIVLNSKGEGKATITCKARSTCRGKISFADDIGPSPRVRSYKVSAGKTASVAIALRRGGPDDPYSATQEPGRDYKYVANVRVRINEDSPRNISHDYTRIVTESLITRQDIAGQVAGVGNLATDIRVDLVREIRGGNVEVVKGANIPNGGGSYRLGVNLGSGNTPSKPYKLRIRGRDQDGNYRSWYWRGADDRPTGGGAHIRDGITIRANKYDDFDADFTYGAISGTTSDNAEVTVASPPPSYSGGSRVTRELDIPYCANIFGQTRASSTGAYTIGFLPITSSTNNRYMVGVANGSTDAFYGKDGTPRFGSCYDATNYSRSRTNLITLTSSITGKFATGSGSGNTIKVNGSFSSAFKPTAQGDRWITIREKIPDVKILDAPVVAEGLADSAGNRTFTNLPPGKYWVEVGRRTGCADWYPSRFPNNNLYFKGLDRNAEKWKAFRRLRDLSGDATKGFERFARTADPNPARGTEQNSIPRGYSGWMYREYCKASGQGTINTMDITGTGNTLTKTTSRDGIGAVVKGRVTRSGSKTNKEMMVRLTSADGTRVVRADLTDGSGTFYVAGLASGRWTISVNPDSWRGIDRRFTGRHSVTVKAGKGYNVGTLRLGG